MQGHVKGKGEGELLNVVFYILLLLAVVFLWFLLAFLFKPTGKFFYKLWKDAVDEMSSEKK